MNFLFDRLIPFITAMAVLAFIVHHNEVQVHHLAALLGSF